MLLRVKPSSGLQITRIVKSGSMKLDLQALARSIFTICSEKCISIDIQWIPRSENTKADYISKNVDHEDWGVTYEFFEFIDNMWGPHTIDIFANSGNTVCLIPGTGTLPLNLLMHLHNIGVLITTGLYCRFTASCELLNICCFVKQWGL